MGLVLLLHAVISFLPFLVKNKIASFWEYNRILFSNFFVSGFFTIVIFAGVSLALFALEFLFGMSNFNGKLYAYWFVVMASIFHPIYFLSHFPSKVVTLKIEELPRAFIILVVYILIPISLLYLAILYAYAGKIVVSATLPEGLVSNLVLCFSVVGILTYLLNYMIPSQRNLRLSSIYKSYFFYLMIVPIALLLFAIYVRLDAYGFTEPRYIVAILSLWLLIVSIYMMLSKVDNIKVIPISLAVIVVIALFGPLNMFSVSLNSQLNRLKTALAEGNMLVDGKLVVPDNIDQAIADEIQSKLRFLKDRNGFDGLLSISSESVDLSFIETDKTLNSNELHQKIRKTMRLESITKINVDSNNKEAKTEFTTYYRKSPYDISLQGYSNMLSINTNNYNFSSPALEQTRGANSFSFTGSSGQSIKFDLEDMVKNIQTFDDREIPTADLSYTLDQNGIALKLIFNTITINQDKEKGIINSYSGFLLVKDD